MNDDGDITFQIRLTSCRLLVASSTVLFLLATAHIAISLRQMLEAFTNLAVLSNPRGPDFYFSLTSKPLAVVQYAIYVLSVRMSLNLPVLGTEQRLRASVKTFS